MALGEGMALHEMCDLLSCGARQATAGPCQDVECPLV